MYINKIFNNKKLFLNNNSNNKFITYYLISHNTNIQNSIVVRMDKRIFNKNEYIVSFMLNGTYH